MCGLPFPHVNSTLRFSLLSLLWSIRSSVNCMILFVPSFPCVVSWLWVFFIVVALSSQGISVNSTEYFRNNLAMECINKDEVFVNRYCSSPIVVRKLKCAFLFCLRQCTDLHARCASENLVWFILRSSKGVPILFVICFLNIDLKKNQNRFIESTTLFL